MLGDHKQAWLQERLADLDNGDIPAICAAGRVFPLAGKGRRPRHRARLLRAQRPPHAPRPLQEAGHIRRLRGSRGRMQIDRRAAPQTVRDEMDGIRRHRHPHAALPGSQRPLGADPDPAHRKAGGLNRSGRRWHNQTLRPDQATGQSPTFTCHTRTAPSRTEMSVPADKMPSWPASRKPRSSSASTRPRSSGGCGTASSPASSPPRALPDGFASTRPCATASSRTSPTAGCPSIRPPRCSASPADRVAQGPAPSDQGRLRHHRTPQRPPHPGGIRPVDCLPHRLKERRRVDHDRRRR